MKQYTRTISRAFSHLWLVGGLALLFPAGWVGSAAAQSLPSGPFGFVLGVSQIDSAGANGGAAIGIINLDGSGSLSGGAIVKPRGTKRPQDSQAVEAAISGTYSANPDGTLSAIMNFDVGFSLTVAMVPTDGGQGFELLSATCAFCAADIPYRGQDAALAGVFPVGLVLPAAPGNATIPLSLKAVDATGGGVTVYTAAPAGGSGPATCRDGSTGTWSAQVPSMTIAINPDIRSASANGTPLAGNFMAAVIGNVCGDGDFETVSGLVTGTINPAGAAVLSLHAVGGGVASGVARAVKGGSLNGSYGFRINFSPFPSGSLGVMKFDGAGNATVSLTGFSNTGLASAGTFTGTYKLDDDSSGTITLLTPAGQPGPVWTFVLTDGGAELLLLRSDANPQFDVAYGTARLQ